MNGDGLPSIGDALLAQRRVMLGGGVDVSALNHVVAQLMLLDGQSADPVSLVVTGATGSLESSLGLLDTLAVMRAPVMIDMLGAIAGGPAAALVGAPGLRRLGPTASLSLRLSTATMAAAANADAMAQEAARQQAVRTSVAERVAARCGRTVDWVLDEFDRGGPANATEALARGLVDQIR